MSLLAPENSLFRRSNTGGGAKKSECRKKHWGDGSREPLHFFHFFPSIPSYWGIIQNIYIIHLQGFAAIRLSTNVLGKQKKGFRESDEKKCRMKMWKWSGNTGAESPIADPVSPQDNGHLLCHFINEKHRLQNSCIFPNKNSFLCTKHASHLSHISPQSRILFIHNVH